MSSVEMTSHYKFINGLSCTYFKLHVIFFFLVSFISLPSYLAMTDYVGLLLHMKAEHPTKAMLPYESTWQPISFSPEIDKYKKYHVTLM